MGGATACYGPANVEQALYVLGSFLDLKVPIKQYHTRIGVCCQWTRLSYSLSHCDLMGGFAYQMHQTYQTQRLPLFSRLPLNSERLVLVFRWPWIWPNSSSDGMLQHDWKQLPLFLKCLQCFAKIMTVSILKIHYIIFTDLEYLNILMS